MKDQRRFRPCLETLEGRSIPAAGTVTGTFAPLTGTWTLTGDVDPNDITINPTATPGEFVVTGNNGTSVAGVDNPMNVKNIVVKLLAGDDVVNVNDTDILSTLAGNLTVNGGVGANFVWIRDMTINKSVSVTNGTNATGNDGFYLEDSSVKGKVTINNGNGDSETNLYRTTPGISYIGKSLSVTNGTGYDEVEVIDYNIGGNVTVKNGLPDETNEAGYAEIYNELNTTGRSLIGGSVLVTYQGGNVDYDGIWDYEVLGNATFKYGAADGDVRFDGYKVPLPVLIRGNLTITGSGATDVFVGYQGYLHTGLVVGKNLTITTGNAADTFQIFGLRVNGATKIVTGGGIDTITIDDSHFLGLKPSVNPFGFLLSTGAGADVVDIDTTDVTTFPPPTPTPTSTQFVRAVKILMGDDGDTLTLGLVGDDGRRVELFGKGILLGGAGDDTLNQNNLNALFGAPISVDFDMILP